MSILTGCCILLTLGYLALMYAYRTGWARQKTFSVPATFIPGTSIAVIIPARNEAANIGACLDAILAQKYPTALLEIIVVDDHSEDETSAIVKEYAGRGVQYINLADHLATNGQQHSAYKKAAIAAGIAASKATLITTTDADCTAPNSWLLHIAALYEQQQPAMIVAPVIYTSNSTILQLFQLTDFMSMQGITAAAHQLRLGNMSNGANLTFTRAAYNAVKGYEGITHLASGDDYLLMMKMHKLQPQSITYLKASQAIVRTLPQPTWAGFLQQRIRWASKSGKYDDKRLTAVLLFVYLFNVSFLLLAIAGFGNMRYWYMAAAMLLIKTTAEYIFLKPVARFFNKEGVFRYFAFLQPLHILYIIIAGLLGFMGTYSWKGRTVK